MKCAAARHDCKPIEIDCRRSGAALASDAKSQRAALESGLIVQASGGARPKTSSVAGRECGSASAMSRVNESRAGSTRTELE